MSYNQDKMVSFGIVAPLEECVKRSYHFYTALELVPKFHLKYLILDANVENEQRKRGFDVLFEEFNAKVNLCKSNLKEANVTAKIMFVTGWPQPTDLNDHYDFVRYWENVIEWAEQTKTYLILNSAFDSEEMGGWWMPQPNVSGIEKLKLETQKESLHKKVVDERKKLQNNMGPESWLFGMFGAAAVTCIITITSVTIIFVARKKLILSKDEMDDFLSGRTATAGPTSMSYDRENYEIAKASFSITKVVLGSGSHGNVFLGRVHGNRVAVKIGSTTMTKDKLFGVLSEIKTLAYLGKHENIIELIGVSTSGLRTGNIMVFLELCGLGSLEKYLKEKKREYNKNVDRDGANLVDMELFQKLMKWASDIANGMEYVASKKIVHLDLAARNILLTDNEQVKISDFCLSQYLSGTYVVTNENALPWRWMGVECFSNFAFTEKSDVWAFGVTLWEMFSLGELPYGGGQSFNDEFTTALSQGHRLAPPLYNRNGIYELMRSCWHGNPEERPVFGELEFALEEIMEVDEIRQGCSVNASNYYVL